MVAKYSIHIVAEEAEIEKSKKIKKTLSTKPVGLKRTLKLKKPAEPIKKQRKNRFDRSFRCNISLERLSPGMILLVKQFYYIFFEFGQREIVAAKNCQSVEEYLNRRDWFHMSMQQWRESLQRTVLHLLFYPNRISSYHQAWLIVKYYFELDIKHYDWENPSRKAFKKLLRVNDQNRKLALQDIPITQFNDIEKYVQKMGLTHFKLFKIFKEKEFNVRIKSAFKPVELLINHTQ